MKLVTGSAGFIGRHLVRALFPVAGVDFLEEWPSGQFDTVFHLAALARIQPSFRHPGDTLRNNLAVTVKALEFARENNAKFIYAGSSTCNGDVFANPYALSKHMGEEAVRLYARHFGVNCAIARFYNVYGPGQRETGPYATAMGVWERAYREGRPLSMSGDGSKRRDWTHVEDVVSALLAIDGWLEYKPTDVPVFHVGTGRNVSVGEVVAMFGGEVDRQPDRPGEAEVTLADNQSLRDIGWEPKWRIEDYIDSVKSGVRNVC